MDTEKLISSLLGGGSDQNQSNLDNVDADTLLNSLQQLQSGLQALEGGAVPTPGFVVKTNDESGRKYFLNICTSDLVPLPQDWPSSSSTTVSIPPPVVRFLDPNNTSGYTGTTTSISTTTTASPIEVEKLLQVPMYTSKPRNDIDHNGATCTVVDCVVSPIFLQQTSTFRPLKLFLCQLALNIVESECGVRLNPQHKLPKMRSKGKPASIELPQQQNDKNTTANKTKNGDNDSNNSSDGGGISLDVVGKKKSAEAASVILEESIASPPAEPAVLRHAIQYLGTPCTTIQIILYLNHTAARIACTAPHSIAVNITSAGEAIQVSIPTTTESSNNDVKERNVLQYTISIPFCIAHNGATATVSDSGKKVMIVGGYKPVQEVWQEQRHTNKKQLDIVS